MRIRGLAWDPIIDAAWWPPAAPNDNLGHYRLDFWKQFGPAHELLADTGTPHPAFPALPSVIPCADADAEELAQWDLTALDARRLLRVRDDAVLRRWTARARCCGAAQGMSVVPGQGMT